MTAQVAVEVAKGGGDYRDLYREFAVPDRKFQVRASAFQSASILTTSLVCVTKKQLMTVR